MTTESEPDVADQSRTNPPAPPVPERRAVIVSPEGVVIPSPQAEPVADSPVADSPVPAAIVDPVASSADAELVDLTPAVSEHVRALPFATGDTVEGTVVKLESDGVLVDLGTWREGFVPARELAVAASSRPDALHAIGDRVRARVLSASVSDPLVRLSPARLQLEDAWSVIEAAAAGDGIVTGKVGAAVKGGLRVDVGVEGFIPASLVDVRPIADLSPFVGQEVTAKIIEADAKRFRVVLSRRAVVEGERKLQRDDVMERLRPGDVVDGVVSSVTDIGAFVDVGGADGLVHVSELTWGRQRDPRKVVSPGTQVQVKVLEVDPSRDRISLSLRQTTENPWDTFVRSHSVGEVVTGTVTKNMEFGSFVEVADGVEGLVHVSELAPQRVERPDDVVKVGDPVQVRIVDIDSGRRRLSLSVRAVDEPEGARRATSGGGGGGRGGRGGRGGGGAGGGRGRRGGGFGRQSFGESDGDGLSTALSKDSLGALEALKASLDDTSSAGDEDT